MPHSKKSSSQVQSHELPQMHKAVRLHPADLTIHVEEIQAPEIEEPDDAIVKVKLAGLCGSDLHGYRGHEKIHEIIVTGHEFIGEVVALGSSYSPNAVNRPPLYSTLKVGDFVVSPFSASCGECHFCRIGYTSRCAHQLLFGSEALPGGQAQYVRVPRAGGVLFVIRPTSSSDSEATSGPHDNLLLSELSESSLLLLADILPTGVFTALQTIQHPNVLPIIRGERFPLASVDALLPSGTSWGTEGGVGGREEVKTLKERLFDPYWPSMKDEDRVLNIAVIGLGPVGICATIALFDFLASLKTRVRLYAIDLVKGRRDHVQDVVEHLPPEIRENGELIVTSPDEAESLVMEATGNVGCNAIMEVVGNNSALILSYALLRPFGVIVSAGVHQSPPLPFTGRQFYNKNVALVSGRCPVRTVFPLAVDLLQRRQDVFATPSGSHSRSHSHGHEHGHGHGSSLGHEHGHEHEHEHSDSHGASHSHGHSHGGIHLRFWKKGGKSIAGVERVVSIDDAPEAYKKFAKGEWGKVAFDPWN